MDACDLQFLNESFEMVTAFFTLMYIPKESWDSIFSEVWRVLKASERFLLWDGSFTARTDKKICIVPLAVVFPDGTRRETGYGCRMHDQELDDFLLIAKRHGFKVVSKKPGQNTFHLRLQKPRTEQTS